MSRRDNQGPRWFRSWASKLDNPKLQRLSDAHYAGLLGPDPMGTHEALRLAAASGHDYRQAGAGGTAKTRLPVGECEHV